MKAMATNSWTEIVGNGQRASGFVSNKTENYILYEAGAYGNKFRTWNRLQDIRASGFSGKIVMRYRGKSERAHYPYMGEQIPLSKAPAILQEWIVQGAKVDEIAYNEE
jgi:hypothetical protein